MPYMAVRDAGGTVRQLAVRAVLWYRRAGTRAVVHGCPGGLRWSGLTVRVQWYALISLPDPSDGYNPNCTTVRISYQGSLLPLPYSSMRCEYKWERFKTREIVF